MVLKNFGEKRGPCRLENVGGGGGDVTVVLERREGVEKGPQRRQGKRSALRNSKRQGGERGQDVIRVHEGACLNRR